MVRYSDSKSMQKRKAREKLEENILKAVDAYRAELKKPWRERLGLRKVASMFEGVTPGTLRNRADGQRSITEFNATKQKLSIKDEEQLAALLQLSSDRGLPFTTEEIRCAADAILRERYGQNFEPVGINWVERFIERQHKEVKMFWSTHLDMQRAASLNPSAVGKWFDIVEEGIIKKGILPELIYGMDESGFQLANDRRVRVAGRTGGKKQAKQGGANRETVTAVVTICADGSSLKPLLIYKGQHIMQRWTKNNVADVR